MEDKHLPVEQKPSALIEIALNQGADLDKLEKVLELQERWERNEAKKAYVVAMAAFKADPPIIEKDKHVKFSTQKGITEYDHASLVNVMDKISAKLSEHGLSAAWETKQTDGFVIVSCKITHVRGHSEETTLMAMPDDSGGKNKIQSIGSTISYLQRYTVLALTGLATRDMDDDGNSTGKGVEYIDDKQKSTIMDFLDNRAVNQKAFLNSMKAESVETILASDFDKAVNLLKRTPEKK